MSATTKTPKVTALALTGDPAADKLLAKDPLALLSVWSSTSRFSNHGVNPRRRCAP